MVLKNVFFYKNFSVFQPLPCHHWALIDHQKVCLSTLPTRCEDCSKREKGERGSSYEIWRKIEIVHAIWISNKKNILLRYSILCSTVPYNWGDTSIKWLGRSLSCWSFIALPKGAAQILPRQSLGCTYTMEIGMLWRKSVGCVRLLCLYLSIWVEQRSWQAAQLKEVFLPLWESDAAK